MKSTNLEKVLKKTNTPVIGIGVTAFNRLGPEFFLPNYRIFCLSHGQDLEMIEKDVPIFSIVRAGGKISGAKNSSNIMKNGLIQEEVDKIKKPYLLFYMPNEEIKEVCERHEWEMIGEVTPKKIANKLLFRELLKELGVPVVPGEETRLEGRSHSELKDKYGSFVIQLPVSGGGKGTRFIRTESDFEQARKLAGEEKVIITKLIQGPSPSITGCVTRHGVVYTGLQYQLIDITECINPKKGCGLFCGHDWTSAVFDEKMEDRAQEYVRKIGDYLKSSGYRGIFGLDMVLDKETGKLFVVECNPRLLGSFPTLTMVQNLAGEIPIIAFHIAEFLGLDYEINIEKVRMEMRKPKKGAQLILYNKIGTRAKNTGTLKPGVYVSEKDSITYRRPGYKLSDIKEDEFIIADDVPFEGTVFRPNERILRILSLHPMMDVETYKLNGWTRKIVEKVYSFLGLEAVALETSLTKS